MPRPATEAEAAAEIIRMFDAYGRTPTASQVAEYLALLPKGATLEEVRTGRRDAMAASGDWPPGPGSVRTAIAAVMARRPAPRRPALEAGGPGPVERELARRLAALPRREGVVSLRDHLADRGRVVDALRRDLERLATRDRPEGVA